MTWARTAELLCSATHTTCTPAQADEGESEYQGVAAVQRQQGVTVSEAGSCRSYSTASVSTVLTATLAEEPAQRETCRGGYARRGE